MKSTTKFTLYSAHESLRAARTALLAVAGEEGVDDIERGEITNQLRRLQCRVARIADAPSDLLIRLGADNSEN